MPESPAGGWSMLGVYARALLPRVGTRRPDPPDIALRRVGLQPDPDHIARYADVVGAPAGTHLPLLYPHLLGFGCQLRLLTDPRFPLPALGLVHVSNHVVTTRRIDASARLDVTVNATAVRPHPRGRVVDLVTTVGEDGESVWQGVSTYLHREPGTGASGQVEQADAGQQSDRGQGPGESPSGPAGPAAALHPSTRWALRADLGRRYAAVSGDVNPIHLHPLSSRAFGFRRPIAHGMWTAAAAIAALDHRLPEAVGVTVEFRRPIPLPSTQWLFTAMSEAGARAEVRRKGTDGNGEVLLTARVSPR